MTNPLQTPALTTPVPPVGSLAPDFSLPSNSGQTITLSSFQGHKNVVLVFYPLDFSPVCSMQLPEYSGRQDDFADTDTVVLGINRDSVHTHKAWAAEYGIEVPLLADMNLDVASRYGVAIDERSISGRAIFLIDKAGMLRFCFVEEKTGDYTLRPEQVLKKIKAL